MQHPPVILGNFTWVAVGSWPKSRKIVPWFSRGGSHLKSSYDRIMAITSLLCKNLHGHHPGCILEKWASEPVDGLHMVLLAMVSMPYVAIQIANMQHRIQDSLYSSHMHFLAIYEGTLNHSWPDSEMTIISSILVCRSIRYYTFKV